MRILICDDETVIYEQIKSIILSEYPESNVATVSGSKELCEKYNNEIFDVIFMDIMLKGENGIDLGHYLSNKMPDAKIIFISGYQDKVSDIFFNLNPYGFIDKPIDAAKVIRYIDSIKQHENAEYFEYSEKGKTRKIPFKDILYVESSREKVFIYAHTIKFYVWKKISDIEQSFPENFVRCHKSFLVNMKFVSEITSSSFKLFDGTEISISRSKKEDTLNKYYKFKGGIC